MNNKEISALFNRIFYSQWLCSVPKDSLAIIKTPPKGLNLVDRTYRKDTGERYLGIDITCEITSGNEAGIIELLSGGMPVTIDMEMFLDCEIDVPETASLSTASIAEIVYNLGQLTILDHANMVSIYNDVVAYINHVDAKSRLNLHAIELPPEEDMDAFRYLVELIEPAVQQMMACAIGDSAASALKAITRSNQMLVDIVKKQVIFNGGPRDTTLHVNTSPFDFHN